MDFGVFGVWDGTAVAVWLVLGGAVARNLARLDRRRGPAFKKSERICSLAGTAMTALGAAAILASWTLLPRHAPGIWCATFVTCAVTTMFGWYRLMFQMAAGTGARDGKL